MRSHAAAATELLIMAGVPEGKELVKAILADWNTAPISEPDRLLYAAIEMFTARRRELVPEVHRGLEAAGWTQAQILEAMTVCALFCFYNAWVDLAGLDVYSDSDYEASGKRLAAGATMQPIPASSIARL